MTTTRWQRPTLRSLLLAGGIAMSMVMGLAGRSEAAYAICRTDPTIYLSDGTTMVAYADIKDDASDIQNVNYEVHVPSGVIATGMTYDQYGSVESVTIIDDQPLRSYSVGISITTGANAAFTAFTSISGSNCTTQTAQQNGSSGHTLWLSFTC
jgi:hypothetical protein